jgi:hypothetical protein
MRWLGRLAERFSVAASLVRHPGDGWRFRPGCSIGRPARPGVFSSSFMVRFPVAAGKVVSVERIEVDEYRQRDHEVDVYSIMDPTQPRTGRVAP